MDAARNVVSEHLRGHKQAIIDRWFEDVRERPDLANLDKAVIVDHLPEFLDALADWLDGDDEASRRVRTALAEGHAVQRLGFGVSLETITHEYGVLRSVVMRELLRVPTGPAIREPMVRFNEAMDVAVHESVRRYTAQRDQLRDRFVGILGHDLRNPLGAITIGAARLSATLTDPAARRIATAIARSAERMSRMIEDVLDFTRVNLGGGIAATLSSQDMGEMCQAAIDEMRAAHPEREIDVETSGDLRGQWDRDRVLQALSNLLGNAVQHGTAPVVLRAHETPDRRAVVTSVTNAGTPIPPDRLRTLFDPFRAGAGNRHGGLGLGLYIVRQIALGHGATCSVESTAEAGTTFSIRWPRTPVDKVPDRG